MQLYYFLAVVISLTFGSLPSAPQDPMRSVMFSAAVIFVWWIICFLSTRMVSRLIDQGEITCETGFDWFDRQTTCLRWFSLALISLCLGGFGLGRCVDQFTVTSRSMTAQAIALLIPTMLILLGLWSAEHRFLHQMRLVTGGMISKIKWIGAMIRSTVAWFVVPVLIMLVLVDLSSLLPVDRATRGWLLAGSVFAAAVVGFPFVLRNMFPKGELDETTRRWIEDLLRACDLPRCRIFLWDTAGRTHNAMMVGFVGRFQVLFLTDKLLRDLSRHQIAMVILHEVAHAKRRHAVLRIVALFPVWLLGILLPIVLGAFTEDRMTDWSFMIGNGISLLATVVLLRLVSHYCEFDADAKACELAPVVAQKVPDVPASKDEAKTAFSSALLRVTDSHDSVRGPSWLHPAVSQRIDAVLS